MGNGKWKDDEDSVASHHNTIMTDDNDCVLTLMIILPFSVFSFVLAKMYHL